MKSICKQCKTEFSAASEALKHHLEAHQYRQCLLCKNPALGSAFCETCQQAFPETQHIDGYDRVLAILQKQLGEAREMRIACLSKLQVRFNKKKADLFCNHGRPKTETCKACEAFNAKTVQTHKKIVYIEL